VDFCLKEGERRVIVQTIGLFPNTCKQGFIQNCPLRKGDLCL
jgi:hypothetical protein